jgi:DedD protein
MGRADTELFKDKIEVSLDGRQIFFLFFGGAVIASLVFVLGVMVGKRVEARAHVERSAATSAALDPLAALDQLGGDEHGELAFPVALAGGDEAAEIPLGAVDAELGELPAAKGASSAKPEERPKAAAKAKKPEVAKPEPAASAKKPPAASAKKDQAAPKREDTPEPKAGARAEEKAEKKVDPEPEEEKEPAPAAKKKKKYTLQLSSFQDRAEADVFYSEMVEAGYQPYLVEAEVPGKGTWFRIRLGRYDSYSAAIEAKKAFEARQKIIAYVTRIKR